MNTSVIEKAEGVKGWSEALLVEALRGHFDARQYAVLPQVRNGTGYASDRTCDALVMGLWPSKGLELWGFEIKCSRSDWQKEMQDVTKAEAFKRHCDRWWLLVSEKSIVKDGELPADWGMMAATPARNLRVYNPAPKLTPVPYDSHLFASICRNLQRESADEVVAARISKVREDERASARTSLEVNTKHLQDKLTALQSSLDAFEKASGVRIDRYGGQRIGEAVRFVLDGGVDSAAAKLEYLRSTAQKVIDTVDGALAKAPRSDAA